MRKSIVIFIPLFLLCSILIAQQSQWQWARQDGDNTAAPPSSNTATGFGTSFSGNDQTVLTVGTYRGDGLNAGTFGGQVLGCWGLGDIFITKVVTSTGGNIWGKRAGSSKEDHGNAITCHSSGNFYITGRIYNGGVFPPLAPLVLPTPTYFWYVAKYDVNGNCTQVKTGGYQSVQGKDDEGMAICVDNQDGFTYVGGFENVRGFVAKINNQLSTAGQWYAYLRALNPGSEAIVTGVTMDGDGYIVATGNFKGDIKLYHGSPTDLVLGAPYSGNTADMTTAGDWDIFTLRIRPTGDILWHAQNGGVSDDFARGIASNHGIGLAGATFSTGYFHSSPIKFNSSPTGTPNTQIRFCNGQNDIYVCAYQNSDGTLLSAQTYGSTGEEISTSITYRVGPNSGMTGPVITGNAETTDMIYLPCAVGTLNGTHPFVLKTNDKCEMLDSWWYNEVRNTNNTTLSSNSICMDRENYFYITGDFNQQVNFSAYTTAQIAASTNKNVFNACIQNFAHGGDDDVIPMGTPEIFSTPPISYLWTATGYAIPFANATQALLTCPGTYGIPAGTTYVVHPDLPCGYDTYSYFGGYDFDDNTNNLSACRISSTYQDDLSSAILIAPNPSSGDFKISITGVDDEISNVCIMDLSGRILYQLMLDENDSDDPTEISLPGFTKGIYFVEVKTATNKFVSKILIQ